MNNLIDKESQSKINFLKTQAQRAYYLDEFKENIAMALTERQLNSGYVYSEVFEEMKKNYVSHIKIKREIPFKNIKPYIKEAEKYDIQYILVDSLSLLGDIAMVIVSKEAFDDDSRDIILEDIQDKFIKRGLYGEVIKYFDRKICKKHYNEISKKVPEYINRFKILTLIDRLLGNSCPICKLEKEKK